MEDEWDDDITDSQLATACDVYEQLCEPQDCILIETSTVYNDDDMFWTAEDELLNDVSITSEQLNESLDNTLLNAAVELEEQQMMLTDDGKQFFLRKYC